MIEGNDIICFSNDWDGDPLSKKHIISRLAKKNRVLWVNSIGNRNPSVSAHDFHRVVKKLRDFSGGCRQVDHNIHVFSPLVIPFHGNAVARAINRKLLAATLRRQCAQLGFRNPIVWSFVPSSGEVVCSLGARLVVYHCVDEFSEFTGTNRDAILAMERRLMESSDLVIVSSSRLYDSKRRYNRNTFLVRHGVDVEHFRQACFDTTPLPEDCRDLRHPVVGFFGLIADWVDLEVIRCLASARAHWSFLLIGKVQTDVSKLQGLPNVRFLGRRDYASLPGYCKSFDVSILPFVVNELTIAANPLKLREYLAAGVPVVATPLPEVRSVAGAVRTAATPQEFLNEIEALLSQKRLSRLAVSHQMDGESWDEKVEQLSRLVEGISAATPAIATPPAAIKNVAA